MILNCGHVTIIHVQQIIVKRHYYTRGLTTEKALDISGNGPCLAIFPTIHHILILVFDEHVDLTSSKCDLVSHFKGKYKQNMKYKLNERPLKTDHENE